MTELSPIVTPGPRNAPAAAVPSLAPNSRSQNRRHLYARGKGRRYTVACTRFHANRRAYSRRAYGKRAVRSSCWKTRSDDAADGAPADSPDETASDVSV